MSSSCGESSNFELAFQRLYGGKLRDKKRKKCTYMFELDVRKPVVESILQRSEDLRRDSFFRGFFFGWLLGFSKRRSPDLSHGTNVAFQLTNFSFYLIHIYSLRKKKVSTMYVSCVGLHSSTNIKLNEINKSICGWLIEWQTIPNFWYLPDELQRPAVHCRGNVRRPRSRRTMSINSQFSHVTQALFMNSSLITE
jgi:hypothetical protein